MIIIWGICLGFSPVAPKFCFRNLFYSRELFMLLVNMGHRAHQKGENSLLKAQGETNSLQLKLHISMSFIIE